MSAAAFAIIYPHDIRLISTVLSCGSGQLIQFQQQ